MSTDPRENARAAFDNARVRARKRVSDIMASMLQSDLAYPVLFYPDPSSSGNKSLVTDLQHTLHVTQKL